MSWVTDSHLYSRFIGKPDPYPGDSILQPDDVFLAAFLARYGHTPGNPAYGEDPPFWIPGFANEMFPKNRIALTNWNTAQGHPGVPTMTEQLDCAYSQRKWDNFYRDFWYKTIEGGSAANPVHVSEMTRPHGAYDEPHPFAPRWVVYYFNDAEGTIDPPGPPEPPGPPVPPDPPPIPPPAPCGAPELPARVLETLTMATGWIPEGQKARRSRLAEARKWGEKYVAWWEARQ